MKTALKKVIAKRKQAATEKIVQSKTLVDYFGSKDRFATNYSLKDFRHMLLCPEAKPVRLPLSCQYATHLKTIKYRSTLQVNASGNALYIFQPSISAQYTTTATCSPLIAINHANYLPAGGNVTAAWVNVPNYDLTWFTSTGMNIVQAQFESVSVVSAHVKFTLTGVSNLNKQGKIYIAESLRTEYNHGNNVEFVTPRALADVYAIPNLVKLKHYREAEIMNMDASTAISYHYIPHASYSDIFVSEPDAINAPANVAISDGIQQLAFLVNGAAANTVINAEFTIHVQCRPTIDNLNNFPVEFGGCYDNPDPTMRRLQCYPEAVIRTCLTDTLKSAKLDGNFQ